MTSFSNVKVKELISSYDSIKRFCQEYNKINYIEFDYYTVNKVNLFAIIENFDFNLVDEAIEKMVNAIGPIKRIFSKPIIHLKDMDEILPVESVRVVNNETIIHASIHSELWENITSDNNIKPRKLLTRNNQDDYQIYENQVFTYTINIMLAFLKDNIKIYKEFMYNNRNLNFDLLDRLDHINYYLAIGKLHTGYIRNLEKYYSLINRAINRMQYIYNILKSRLNRPVYKMNKNIISNKKIVLRKTNILKMHKDYHQIYNLITFLNDNNISNYYDNNEEINENESNRFLDSYFYFLEVISIFSIGHFNFQICHDSLIDFDNLNLKFKYKCWDLYLTKKNIENIDFLEITLSANKIYKVLLFPSIKNDKNDMYNNILKITNANEYYICSPDCWENSVYVSITNVDSFRRIQQIVLKMMVYSDESMSVCPFCGDVLVKDENEYVCSTCKTVIGNLECTEYKKDYRYTEIKDYKQFVEIKKLVTNDYNDGFDIEGLMHFRNITKIDEHMNIICPYCNKSHNIKSRI